MTEGIYQKVAAVYPNNSFLQTLFMWGRWQICPFETLTRFLPPQGRMAELGCGIGLFSNTASLIHPHLKIDAYDQNPSALQIAQKTIGERSNIRFFNEDVRKLDMQEVYDVVAMIDLIHHIPYQDQASALLIAWKLLKPGGSLLLKDVDDNPLWKRWMSYWHDMVQFHPPYLLKKKNLIELIQNSSFQIQSESRCPLYYVPHIAYLATKRIRNY